MHSRRGCWGETEGAGLPELIAVEVAAGAKRAGDLTPGGGVSLRRRWGVTDLCGGYGFVGWYLSWVGSWIKVTERKDF